MAIEVIAAAPAVGRQCFTRRGATLSVNGSTRDETHQCVMPDVLGRIVPVTVDEVCVDTGRVSPRADWNTVVAVGVPDGDRRAWRNCCRGEAPFRSDAAHIVDVSRSRSTGRCKRKREDATRNMPRELHEELDACR